MANNKYRVSVDWSACDLYTDATNTGGKSTGIQWVKLVDSSGGAITVSDATAANQVLQLAQETAISGKLPAALGSQTGAGSLSVVPASDGRFVLANAMGIPSGAPTYTATATGYTAYATPTDMFTIYGSATKTIAVTGLVIEMGATAGTLVALYWIKRSAVNTGGTSSSLTPVAFDTLDAAATATVKTYTAAPTLGAAIGTIAIVPTTTGTLTGAPSTVNYPTTSGVLAIGASSLVVDMRKPIILRGVAEGLALGLNGAGLPAGSTFTVLAQFVEF